MRGRPATTLVLLAGRSAAVVPVGRGRLARLEHEHVARSPIPEGSLAERLQALLDAGVDLGRRTFVLDADLWADTLELPSGAVEGLAPAELERAAAFEVESLTGIPAARAATSVRRVDHPSGAQRYLVVQAMQSEIDAAARLARRAGTQIEAITHPVGLEAWIGTDASDGEPEPAPSDSWRRVEVWPQGVFLVERRGTTSCVSAFDVQASGPWERALERWEQSHGTVDATEVLYAPDLAPDVPRTDATPATAEPTAWPPTAVVAPAPAPRLIEDDASLARLLEGWWHQLRDGGGARVLKATPKQRSRSLLPVLAGLALAAAVGAWSYTAYEAAGERVTELQSELTRVEAPAGRLAELRRSALRLETDVRGTERRRDELARDAARADAKHESEKLPLERLRGLMPGIASAVRGDLVVDELAVQGDTCTLRGTGLSANAIAGFAARLAEAPSLAGAWKLGAPTIQPRDGPHTSLWIFAIDFRGFGASAQAPAHRVNGATEW